MGSVPPPTHTNGMHEGNMAGEVKPSPSEEQKVNHWASPGLSEWDFRSDTLTTPTMNMLQSIAQTTLRDDVFEEDPTTHLLESRIAEMTGFEASLFVLSGTMGNQLSLRTHVQAPPTGILCDLRSHIYQHEAGGCSWLSGAVVQVVTPKNGHHLTLADVQKHAVLDDNVHLCPTRIISLENTLNGTILPLSEVQAISKWARERGIIMHLDGARLWEAVAASAGTLKEYCACFDSVSLCFSKGLGAPIGSIIAGSRSFIKRARHLRKPLGGGLRQSGVITAPALCAVNDTFLGGKLQVTHANAKRIAATWQGLGGHFSYPVETNMVWLDLEASGVPEEKFLEVGKAAGLNVRGGRLVVHYQISEQAIQKLEVLLRELMAGRVEPTKVANGASGANIGVEKEVQD